MRRLSIRLGIYKNYYDTLKYLTYFIYSLQISLNVGRGFHVCDEYI